ncbi:MAG: leucyl aminopeptidase [Chitinophagales bacterium]|nr:leucyl aminopeptidase [Hyphomicrobiales bacterium]
MIDPSIIHFVPLKKPEGQTLALFIDESGALPPTAKSLDQKSGGTLLKAMAATDFKGKSKSVIEVLAPAELPFDRVLMAGVGKYEDHTANDWLNLGGVLGAKFSGLKNGVAGVVAETNGKGAPISGESVANIALGIMLRSYKFKKYKTKKPDPAENDDLGGVSKIEIYCSSPNEASSHFAHLQAVGEGVVMARDLVNEPANVLGPLEFADRLRALEDHGLDVEVLDEAKLAELKMLALLGVGQGSDKPTFAVVMRWNGAKNKRAKPIAFVGKGVTFDTGGISMKPAAGMEDMKGDMGGAACVAGLMLELAKRRAPVNVVGVVGLVENMNSGGAQRPGDIITSMSGQTIEILNTDAEGRLVLADLLTYTQEYIKPKFAVTLATLTGAIIVALGKEYAGVFGNNDQLCERLVSAGQDTDEKLWRLPLSAKYDKLIDSSTADMKNIGGRDAGSITAAQFLKRFVNNDLPWAHIDIAGTAMASPSTDINQSWGSGFGVRLLDRLVYRYYETPSPKDNPS